MNQIRGAIRRRRTGRLTWHNGATILTLVLSCAVSIAFWRAVVIENDLTVADQVDYEDAALCIRFGFARGTPEHNACKLDLLDLRRSHEQLMARTSLP